MYTHCPYGLGETSVLGFAETVEIFALSNGLGFPTRPNLVTGNNENHNEMQDFPRCLIMHSSCWRAY